MLTVILIDNDGLPHVFADVLSIGHAHGKVVISRKGGYTERCPYDVYSIMNVYTSTGAVLTKVSCKQMGEIYRSSANQEDNKEGADNA